MRKAERMTEENKRIDAELQKKSAILANLTEVSDDEVEVVGGLNAFRSQFVQLK